MNRLFSCRTFILIRKCQPLLTNYRHLSYPSPVRNSKESVDEYVQRELLKAPTNLPLKVHSLMEVVKQKFRKKKDFLDPELKMLLDKAATQLYYDCANKYPYLALCQAFDLPDYMSSWFKLTLMHVWVVLLRLHVALDAAAYERIKSGLLTTLWMDVDKRLEVVGEEINQKLNTSKDVRKMNGLYVQTLLEYDEGFLQDDPALASAIWRNLYMQRTFDPIHVSRVVRYMRATVAYLDSIPVNDILVNGVPIWKPGEALKNSLNK